MLDLGMRGTVTGYRNGGICRQNRGRARARPASRSSMATRKRGARPLLAAGLSCLLGEAARACSRPGRPLRPRAQSGRTRFWCFNQQFLTLIRRRAADPDSLELLIKRQKDASLKAVLENVRDRVKGGELLSDAFAAQSMFPQDLHHHADGGREERQHGRGAEPLHRVSAAWR